MAGLIFTPRAIANLKIGFEAVGNNKLRSLLTALGVIFGVAAVIAMLAIGNGAQTELLEQMKAVGVNNIVVKAIPPSEQEGSKAEEDEKSSSKSNDQSGSNKEGPKKFSPGLSTFDLLNIQSIIPDAIVVPEITKDMDAQIPGGSLKVRLVGTTAEYLEVNQIPISLGAVFSEAHSIGGLAVCLVGRDVQTKLFKGNNPVGKQIKVGNNWLKIIGVLDFKSGADKSLSKFGIKNPNSDIIIPLKTFLLRYQNRSLVTQQKIQAAMWNSRRGNKNKENYHQLDRVIIKVAETGKLSTTADFVSRFLKRKHNQVEDFEITIPELLLKQQQRTRDVFNIVLGAIAGISLLVGGIGIMNIMLASVLERIKEIGLRLALGATRKDIITQFLVESTLLSVSGGLIGIALGLLMAWGVNQVAQIPTAVNLWSVFISFGVAAMVGLVFGIAPARRAANQSPIESLRYE